MTQTQHTPGPWEIVEAHESIFGVFSEWFNVGPARLDISRHSMKAYKETEANARLIAAAPQLLEALEKIRDLPRYSISQTLLIDPLAEGLLKATKVDPIVSAAIKAATEG